MKKDELFFRILLVDDDEDDAILSRALLSSITGFRYTADWISRYEDALASIMRNEHDVYLLDYRLGAQTGLDLLREAVNNGSRAPFIILTGQGDHDIDLEAMQVGASDYLVKGKIDAPLLERSIRYAIGRKKAENAARQSAKEWQATFDAIGDGVLLVDMKHNIQRCNRAAAAMTGRPPEELVGRPLLDAMRSVPGYTPANDVALSGDVQRRKVVETLVGERSLLVSSDPIMDERGSPAGFVHIVTDVTERKNLEEKLLLSQKMEAIGKLAGGIAHDLNNLMTVVLGNCTDALNKINNDNDVYINISETLKAGERASSLVKQLLAFGRKQMLQVRVLNVNDVIRSIENMFKRVIGEDVNLVIKLNPDIDSVRIDAGQFEQVIVNLVINARDAMPQGGTVTLTTDNCGADEIIDVRPGRYICITVEDTGVGMDKELTKHIFEPFFTTKGLGKGTGLGLSTAYGIIQQHEGWLTVSSEKGKGSRFTIYLPSSKPGAIGALPEEHIEHVAIHAGSKRRILVVEDEDGIRKFVVRVLRERGYEIIDAGSATSALEIYEKENGYFDLVFSDVVLPDKTGLQLAEELLLRNKELKLILTSGYPGEKIQLSVIEQKGFKFIPKPYTMDELTETIEKCLK